METPRKNVHACRRRDLKSTKFVIATRFIDIAGELAICLNKTSIIKHPISTTFPRCFAVSELYQKLGYTVHVHICYIFNLFLPKAHCTHASADVFPRCPQWVVARVANGKMFHGSRLIIGHHG